MNKQKQIIIITGTAILLIIVLFYLVIPSKNPVINDFISVNRPPNIYPDYTELVIPPNIAPLNFFVNEKGSRFFIKIYGAYGNPIEITAKTPKVEIPIGNWKNLLKQNRGKEIKYDIYAENSDGKWQKFRSFGNRIANEAIDSYLAYRLLHPAHHYWGDVGIFQRNLENFDESPILTNRGTGHNCMNCHSFCQNDPNRMMMHLRGGPASGTLINQSGNLIKVNTATAFNKAGSYPAWHPNGKLIAFSVNQLTLFFHAVGESRDVLDHASDLIIYNIASNTITTCPEISSTESMETFPAWSPDGNYLYFCSAPKFNSFIAEKNGKTDLLYDKIRYSLMRIRYNQENGTWGKLDTVLSSAKTGMTILEPRISPDGNYLLFTMAKYGNFPIYSNSSDVYLLDLKTGNYYKPEINSDKAETFHSWSSNSRWLVFNSKRGDNLCARPYFSYVDKKGKAYKPFLLPQNDPGFYSGFLTTYNVPELIKGPVTVSPQRMIDAAFDKEKALQAKLDPKVKPHQETENMGSAGRLSPQ
jgi:hypothetical protein